jgi:hypothetical protein
VLSKLLFFTRLALLDPLTSGLRQTLISQRPHLFNDSTTRARLRNSPKSIAGTYRLKPCQLSALS